MRTDEVEHLDVLIVGAGLSGIGAGCHLRRDCPERSFAILEGRDAIGGTWDLFRYPGARSDSDMQTLGYSFAPWKDDRAIADGPSILNYVKRTAAEGGALQGRGADGLQLPAQPAPSAAVKSLIRRGVRSQLPEGFDVDTHFKPRYDPWDERLCVSPDADLFAALSAGTASIVTDRIKTFTERGLTLAGGAELEADVIVTATGLRMQAIGATALSVDGAPVHLPNKLAYRGMMLSGVPNFAMTIGYTNASWTLKADLTADYVCRPLNPMAARGYRECMPASDAPGVTRQPLLDLTSGHVQRSIRELPAQGSRRPWRMRQNYPLDMLDFRLGDLEDGVMQFSAGRAFAAPSPPVSAAA